MQQKRKRIKSKHMPTTQKVTAVVKSVKVEPGAAGKKNLIVTLELPDTLELQGVVNEDEELDIELPSRPQP